MGSGDVYKRQPLLYSLSLPLPVPQPADVGGSLLHGLEFRPVLVWTLLPALAARDSLPDPLTRPRLPLATNPSPIPLLGVGTAAPVVVDVASNLVRGVPGCTTGVVPLLQAFWWFSTAPGAARFLSFCRLIIGQLSGTVVVPLGECATSTGKKGSSTPPFSAV